MRALAPLLLLLAACASRTRPEGEPASVTLYGAAPRLETWRAFVLEGAHLHASEGGEPCLVEAMAAFSRLALETLDVPPEAKSPQRFQQIAEGLCGSLLGPRHGGRDRLVLLLRPPGDGEPAEALAVDVPKLLPEETERTFTTPALRMELERPAGTRQAQAVRGRVVVRRVAPGRWDVEVFAVLVPGPLQVVARAQAGAAP